MSRNDEGWGNTIDHEQPKRKKHRYESPKLEQEAEHGLENDDSTECVGRGRPRCVGRGPPPSIVPREQALAQNLYLCNKALSFWNETKKPEYELVRAVRSSGHVFLRGIVYHCNFEAKLKDDPEAPVELFFGQVFGKRVRSATYDIVGVEICECLGISSSFPAGEAFTECSMCNYVRHPKNREFTGMTTNHLQAGYLVPDADISETC